MKELEKKDWSEDLKIFETILKQLKERNDEDRRRLLKSVIKFYGLDDLFKSECSSY